MTSLHVLAVVLARSGRRFRLRHAQGANRRKATICAAMVIDCESSARNGTDVNMCNKHKLFSLGSSRSNLSRSNLNDFIA